LQSCATFDDRELDNMPKIVIAGTAHELTDALVTIGRSQENSIVVNAPSVSAQHAQLERSGQTYRLKDLGSTNGTRVNGIPATHTLLRFDDRIRFGAVEARFEADAAGAQPLPKAQEIDVKPAESSVAPADFTNASPFPRRTEKHDPMRAAIFAVAVIGVLAFLASMVAVLMMQPPPV
jgi:predicted component of type VI protein secretion system